MKEQISKKKGIGWTSKLDNTLLHVQLVLERSAMPFVLLGETARSVVEDGSIGGKKIEVGVEKKYATKSSISLLKMQEPRIEETESGYRFTRHDVPVEINIIKRKYKFMKNPSLIFYWVENYYLPNPFKAYWKVRSFVK